MPVYEYKALTEKGSIQKGVIDADTPKEAREKLRAKKVHVTEMIPLARAKGGEKPGVLGSPVRLPGSGRSRRGAGDVPMVTRQLATLLKAGIPLSDALNALIAQIESRNLERAFRQIKEDIASGSGTGEAFARHPQFFNDLYVNMIKAGEASGNLDEILKRLADFLQKQSRNRGKVTAALVYPIAMMILGTVVVIFLMTFVVPKIVASIKERGLPMPLPTEILIGASNFVKDYWWGLLLGVAGLAALYQLWRTSPAGRLQHDSYLLKLPIFGQLFKKQSVARFATTFSTLLKSGIPALECLRILRAIVDNALLAKTLDEVADRIVEGADIATPLKNSGVFPPVVGYMIAIGEQSGQLEDILDKISEAYEEEIDVTTQKVTALIEPIIIVFMALVVGFIVLSVVLPLVQGFSNM
jgi:general secretion pathway protein F